MARHGDLLFVSWWYLSGVVHADRGDCNRRDWHRGLVALASGTLVCSGKKPDWNSAHHGDVLFRCAGAGFYNHFLALLGVSQFMTDWVVTQGLSRWLVLKIILIFYFVLGGLRDSLLMILLTVPIFFPVTFAIDFGMSAEHEAIRFGIMVPIVVEVGLIIPPVGMNLFIINSMNRETLLTETDKAVLYSVGSDVVRVAILVAFPSITLFLLY